MPAIPQNVRFLCYQGFSIFSTDFKGNKNLIQVNISKSKNRIKNRGHAFLLPFILTTEAKSNVKFCGPLDLKLKVSHKMYQM